MREVGTEYQGDLKIGKINLKRWEGGFKDANAGTVGRV
jgi:hypothetical protein